MAFFHYKSKERALKSILLNASCPNCNSSSSLQLTVWLKYFTLYWIPFLPLKKKGEIICTSCKTEFKPDDVVDGKFEYGVLKSKSRAPIWTYTGMFLLVVILFISINGWIRSQEQIKTYLENPKVGDRYAFREAPGDFTLYKVTIVTKDSIYYLKHKTHVNLSKYLKPMYEDGVNEYNTFVLAVARTELMEWYEKGWVRKVIRD